MPYRDVEADVVDIDDVGVADADAEQKVGGEGGGGGGGGGVDHQRPPKKPFAGAVDVCRTRGCVQGVICALVVLLLGCVVVFVILTICLHEYIGSHSADHQHDEWAWDPAQVGGR